MLCWLEWTDGGGSAGASVAAAQEFAAPVGGAGPRHGLEHTHSTSIH